MHLVIDRLVEVIVGAQGISVPAGNLGSRRPSSGSDIPAVSVSLTLETERSPAIGRFIRSGDSLARSSSVIEVKASPDTFSAGLKSLRISPLPLRKNPSSTKSEFGAAQTEGEKLELTHWTVTWRDEILADRFIGSMALEIWANSFNQADGIARNLQDVLRSSRALLREKGFLKLHPFSLGPAEHLRIDPPVGSAIPVWKQKLEYRFAFEAEDGGEW